MLTLILITSLYCLCLSILKEDITPTATPLPSSLLPTQNRVSELLSLIPDLVRGSDLKPYNVSNINLMELLPWP